jgi:DNA-binding PadR family transcriptional regulator
VYPLVERLCKRGLIAENAAASDGRGKRTLTLTKNGEVALDVWFADLGRATAAGFDPLRTRLNMRSLMPQAAYGRFIEDVEAALVRQLDEPPAPPGDDHEWAQALYRLWLEARLDWIARARAAGLFTTTG